MIALAEKLVSEVLPKSQDMVFFANSGAEGIENAVKIARAATGKQNIIVFTGSFHGRTIMTGALTTSKTIYRAGFGPATPGIFVAPYGYCHRCPVSCANPKFGFNGESGCCMQGLEDLRILFKTQTAPEETAAILLEPILGEGGYVMPPVAWMKELRKIATENNVLLIADEVQSGFGRTGKHLAMEHFDVVPDITVMAKGIASGFPLSAVSANHKLFAKCKTGSIGGTVSKIHLKFSNFH